MSFSPGDTSIPVAASTQPLLALRPGHLRGPAACPARHAPAGPGPNPPVGKPSHDLHREKDTYIKSDPRFPVQLLFRFGAVSLQKVLRGGGREREREQEWSGLVAESGVAGTLAAPSSALQLSHTGKAPVSPLLVSSRHAVSALPAVNLVKVAFKNAMHRPVRTVTAVGSAACPALPSTPPVHGVPKA